MPPKREPRIPSGAHRSQAKESPAIPGRFIPRVTVFCDGDFWHGRNWEERRKKLLNGSNASYWVPKIERNRERDREQTRALESEGWKVVRVWGTEVMEDPDREADKIRK